MTAGAGGYQFYDYIRTISNCKNLRGIRLAGSVFAFVYSGLYNDAYILTLTINAVAMKRNILLKSGSYNISADATTVYVVITDPAPVGPVVHTVSAPLSYTNDWNYIVCMYKVGKPLKLYVNANDSAHNGHYQASAELIAGPIASTTQNLIFGGYDAVYDEIGISTRTYSNAEIKTMYHNML